jgi:hypothetical protein
MHETRTSRTGYGPPRAGAAVLVIGRSAGCVLVTTIETS